MKKLIIFDLDGTLADTIEDIRSALNKMLEKYSFKSLTHTDALNNINHGAYELVRRSLPEEYRDNNEFILKAKEIYEGFYEQSYIEKTYVYDGIKNQIELFKNSGYKLAVYSNKQDFLVKNIIKALFPSDTFDMILGQGKFSPKPDPSGINYILQTLEISKENAVLIGDSHVDMETASNAKIDAVGVAWGYRSPEILKKHGAKLIVNSTSELFGTVAANL